MCVLNGQRAHWFPPVMWLPHLTMAPLRFANPSPPSGWIEDISKLSIMLGTQIKAPPARAGPVKR
jgi:hypothetical protein